MAKAARTTRTDENDGDEQYLHMSTNKQPEMVRPRVLLSRCIELEHCRWNGAIIRSENVRRILSFIEVVDRCPEADIGMGVPRSPIRLVKSEDGQGPRLLQPTTGNDYTDRMLAYAATTLHELGHIDGAILKSQSPSCGLRSTKIYHGIENAPVARRGAGLFASAVLEACPTIAIESEARLRNCTLKDHFLTALFTYARFRRARGSGEMRDLIAFHKDNKSLLMAYDEATMRKLGQIVGNADGLAAEKVFAHYQEALPDVFASGAKVQPVSNALLHLYGHYKDRLDDAERRFFIDTLEAYRTERIPMLAVTQLLRSFGLRFGDDYVTSQTIFAPYPLELFDQCELSVRDYWK